jgi:hypothetical protein
MNAVIVNRWWLQSIRLNIEIAYRHENDVWWSESWYESRCIDYQLHWYSAGSYVLVRCCQWDRIGNEWWSPRATASILRIQCKHGQWLRWIILFSIDHIDWFVIRFVLNKIVAPRSINRYEQAADVIVYSTCFDYCMSLVGFSSSWIDQKPIAIQCWSETHDSIWARADQPSVLSTI